MTYILCWNILWVILEFTNEIFYTYPWFFPFLFYTIYISLRVFLILHCSHLKKKMCAAAAVAPNSNYVYVNEDAIDPNLKCPICKIPFQCPVRLSRCHHEFCKQCLKSCLKKRKTCPICCQEVSSLSGQLYKPITTRIVLNQLDELHVQCTLCHQTNIQYGNWKNHVESCPKHIVCCPSADNKCAWKGARESLKEHVENCTLEEVRPVIDELKDSIKKLEKVRPVIDELKDSIKTLEEVRPVIDEHTDSIKTLEEKVKFLLNFINQGNIMTKKQCTKTSGCKYHDRSERSSGFTCSNCETKINGTKISLHACSGQCICESCVAIQYTSSEEESSAESSEVDD